MIDLGAPIDIDEVAIDPGAGCGDDETAGLRDYAVRASPGPNDGFVPVVASGSFGPDLGGALQNLTGAAQPQQVRYVELHAKTPQDGSTGEDGEHFLDVAEIHVARKPGSALGPTTETTSATMTATTARVNGTVIPRGGLTGLRFEYGLPTSAPTPSSVSVPPAGNTAVAKSATLSGLRPSTTYRYRIVAVRGSFSYPGAYKTFKTAAAPKPPVTVPPPTVTPKPPANDPASADEPEPAGRTRGRPCCSTWR